VPLPRTIDEINRLFDELVHAPWSRRLQIPSRGRAARAGTGWELEIPVRGARRDDIVFSIEGREVTVAVRRRKARPGRGEEELLRRSFVIPEGAELSAVEARFEGELLRIRIALHEG